MTCRYCSKEISDGVLHQINHYWNDCPNGVKPLEQQQKELLNLLYGNEDEVKLKVMNGRGVYINTIDEPNVVIIPDNSISAYDGGESSKEINKRVNTIIHRV